MTHRPIDAVTNLPYTGAVTNRMDPEGLTPMGMTNTEKQAAWRARQAANKARVAELEAEVERLKAEVARLKTAALSKKASREPKRG